MTLNKVLFVLLLFFISIGHAQKTAHKKIDSLILLSDQYIYSSTDSCLQLISDAFKYSKITKDTNLILKSGVKLAKALNNEGLYKKGLKTAFEIKSYCTNQPDSLINVAEILYSMALSYLEMERYDDSKKEFNNAIECYKQLNDSSGISACYISLGNIESSLTNLNQSIDFYNKALKFTSSNDSINKAYISTNLGIVYAEQNNYSKAKENIDTTIVIYKNLNHYNELAISLYNLGYLEFKFKHYKTAQKYYLNSLDISKKNKNIINEMWAYEGLYDTYKQQKKYKQALNYYEKYHHINDSLTNIQKDKEIQSIEFDLEKEKQELIINNQLKEIKEANIKEELYKERYNKSKLKAKILGVGFIILCVLGGFGFYIYKKVKKQNAQLSEQKSIINKSLQEKEILLKEIHHRVKNNLQIISSLLNLQSNKIEDKEITLLLNESKNRIQAIALVHDKLYRSNDFTSINFNEYLLEILDQQQRIYLNPNQKIKIITDCEAINLKLDLAVPLGLIASEVITNAFKHAFINHPTPILKIKLKKVNHQIQLTITDNGKGLPDTFNINESNTLGMELITALSEQINSSISFKSNQGTEFSILFELL